MKTVGLRAGSIGNIRSKEVFLMNESGLKSPGNTLHTDIESVRRIKIIKHIRAEYFYGSRVADICQMLDENCDVIHTFTKENTPRDYHMSIAMTIWEWDCKTSIPGSGLPPWPGRVGEGLTNSQIRTVCDVRKALHEIYEWDISGKTWTNPRTICEEVNNDVR